MAAPLNRRFYEVLSNSMYSLIGWLLALIISVTMEGGSKALGAHPEQSYSFFVLTLPLYAVVLFGCYALISIGYHLIVLGKFTQYDLLLNFIEDCKDAQDELLSEIKQARKFLSSKGMKFDTK
jgi:hypothetical protein